MTDSLIALVSGSRTGLYRQRSDHDYNCLSIYLFLNFAHTAELGRSYPEAMQVLLSAWKLAPAAHPSTGWRS
jgi:hypothetical protein